MPVAIDQLYSCFFERRPATFREFTMKKIMLAALLSAAAAIPASAQAQQAYIGLNVGQASHGVDDEGLAVISRSERKTAFKLYGGYQFTKNWGVELGYADFGKARNVYNVGAPLTLEYQSTAVYLAGTGTVPLNEQFALFAKLGISSGRTSGTLSFAGTNLQASGRKSSLMGGIGASYNLTKNAAIALEYEDFGKLDGDSKVNMWSVGLRYKF
jgi:OOP family OmpA-OmpF porin